VTGHHVTGRGVEARLVDEALPARHGIPARPTMRRENLPAEAREILDRLDTALAAALALGVDEAAFARAVARLAPPTVERPTPWTSAATVAEALVPLLAVGYKLDAATQAFEWCRDRGTEARPASELLDMLTRAAMAGYPNVLDHGDPPA
jgi:hypothetical protein